MTRGAPPLWKDACPGRPPGFIISVGEVVGPQRQVLHYQSCRAKLQVGRHPQLVSLQMSRAQPTPCVPGLSGLEEPCVCPFVSSGH